MSFWAAFRRWLAEFLASRNPGPVVNPDPVPDPDPIPDPVPDPTPDPVPDPTPDPVPDPTPDPVPDPTPDPVPDPTPDPVPDPTPDPEPAGPFVRREAGLLGSDTEEWDPIMLGYANAIATMQARADTDPTSWSYQAGIHGFSGTARRLFNQCQHSTWYFLPWHRMYLAQLEQMVREAVIANGGPADWALPFWDYARNPVLPWVFRQTQLPNGDPNPLFVSDRRASRNAGTPLPASTTDSTSALRSTTFGPTTPGAIAPSFGGSQTTPAHFGGGSGALEQTPHNVVHVQMGGWMLDPNQAALDPIFWLHHCNIDRLWELWNRQGNNNSDSAAWGNQTFGFFDQGGNEITMRCDGVVDIEGQLNYTFEGLPPFSASGFDTGFGDEGRPPMPAEMIGGSDEAVILGGDSSTVSFALDAASGPGFDTGSIGDAPQRMYLTIDNVTASAPPSTSYEVILDMGTPDDSSDDFVVGLAGFFGVVEAASADNDEAPHGLTFTYDITEVVDRLTARGLWDGDRATVSFRPVEEVEDDEPTAISVGRVSIFVE